MIGAVCKEINNWFDTERITGEFSIVDGTMTVDGQDGQLARIVGSVFNDGIYELPFAGLKDEEFTGGVWLMAPPQEFLDLVDSIGKWQERNGDAFSGPFTSESFGGYSYTKKTAQDGSEYTWRDAFASSLNRWRKI